MKKGGIYTGYVESVDFPNKGNVIVKTEEDGQTIEEKAVVKNSITKDVSILANAVAAYIRL